MLNQLLSDIRIFAIGISFMVAYRLSAPLKWTHGHSCCSWFWTSAALASGMGLLGLSTRIWLCFRNRYRILRCLSGGLCAGFRWSSWGFWSQRTWKRNRRSLVLMLSSSSLAKVLLLLFHHLIPYFLVWPRVQSMMCTHPLAYSSISSGILLLIRMNWFSHTYSAYLFISQTLGPTP